MKLLSAQGQFGLMNGELIEFQDGFSVRVMPNESGKTTLCAFLRVMLYGLNTQKRDTKAALADKSRYLPVSGAPMSGRLTVLFQNRPIAIERATGKGGPMQEFRAYFLDTGEPCAFLTPKDCGRVLTGVGEEAFCSSALVDGTDLSFSAPELNERLLALSSTGDVSAVYQRACASLDKWRRELKSTGGHGRFSEAGAELSNVEGKIQKLKELEQEAAVLKAELHTAKREETQARAEYESAYVEYASRMTGKQDSLTQMETECRQKIAALEKITPPERAVREAEDAMFSYQGAVKLEKEKREALPSVRPDFEGQLAALERRQQEYLRAAERAGRPKIRVWAFLMAAVLGFSAAFSIFTPLDFGAYSDYAPYALSAFTLLALVVAFFGSVKKLPPAPFEYEKEKKSIELRRRAVDDEQQQAAQLLAEAYDRLIAAARQLDGGVEDIDQAVAAVSASVEHLQQLQTERRLLSKLSRQLQTRPAQRFEGSEEKRQVEEKRGRMSAARAACERLTDALAENRGRALSLGDRAALEEKRAALVSELGEIEMRLDALSLAKDVLESANASLTSRVSPRISALAEDYFQRLTCGRYGKLWLRPGFEAECVPQGAHLPLSVLRLSTGARDQLYFALRLAVCRVLLPEQDPPPLVLDDPFLSFDDERTARALELLSRFAKNRQVIVLSARRLPIK